jgi:uncharacterized protein (DUF433 family)
VHGDSQTSAIRNRCYRSQVVKELDRITRDIHVMGGRACIRGMRVTVGMVAGQIGAGHSIKDLLVDYPCLDREDVLQALRYTAGTCGTV